MKRVMLTTLVLAAAAPPGLSADEPRTAQPGAAQQGAAPPVGTVTISPKIRSKYDNELKSVESDKKVALTWNNASTTPLGFVWLTVPGPVMGNTAWKIPAQGQFALSTFAGHAFRVDSRDSELKLMIPDGAFEHPDQPGAFEATQQIDVTPRAGEDALYIWYQNDIAGRFICMNGRRTGYGAVWKKEVRKGTETEISYYVQVAGEGERKVIRNMATRHTIRMGRRGGEEAFAGNQEWKPIAGSWIDPK